MIFDRIQFVIVSVAVTNLDWKSAEYTILKFMCLRDCLKFFDRWHINDIIRKRCVFHPLYQLCAFDVVPNLTVFTEFFTINRKNLHDYLLILIFSEYNSLVTMKTFLSLSLQCHFFVFFQQCPMMGI